MNKKKLFRILLSIALISFTALFSGCQNISSLSEGIGKAIYNPVYEDKIVGFNVTEIKDESGNVISTKSEPVIHRVITKYEPNELGKLLKLGADIIPIPGAGSAMDGLLVAGGIAMLGINEIRRREKKKRLTAEDYVEVAIDSIQEFGKTDEGKVIVAKGIDEGKTVGKMLKNKVKAKMEEAGIAKSFKMVVKALT